MGCRVRERTTARPCSTRTLRKMTSISNNDNTPNFVGWLLIAVLLSLLIASMVRCDRRPMLDFNKGAAPEKVLIKSNHGNIAMVYIRVVGENTQFPQDTTYIKTFKGDTLYMEIKLDTHADSIEPDSIR